MIARIHRLRRARQINPDAGITLIELIVAMGILTVLSTIVIGTYASTVKVIGTASEVNVNSKEASNAMNEGARQIRAATSNPVSGSAANDPAVVDATNESVVLYTYVNLQSTTTQLPEQVRLRVDPTTRQFKEDMWAGTQSSAGFWTFPLPSTPPKSTRILAGYVASPTGTNPWTFTYMAGATALPVPATGFTLAQRNSITAIQLTLTVETNITTASQSVTLQNTVGMPNLNQ
ncbi:MAG TPA: prepilin-type N-terminal cleavage/methylation domain-containing protein [Galbitalea sp.]